MSTATVAIDFSVTVGYDNVVSAGAAADVEQSIVAIDQTQFVAAISTSAEVYGLGRGSAIAFTVSPTSFMTTTVATTAVSATPTTTTGGTHAIVTRKAFFTPAGRGCMSRPTPSGSPDAHTVDWRIPADGGCHYIRLYPRSLHYAGSYARVITTASTSATRRIGGGIGGTGCGDITVQTFDVSDCRGEPLTIEIVPAKQFGVCRSTLCQRVHSEETIASIQQEPVASGNDTNVTAATAATAAAGRRLANGQFVPAVDSSGGEVGRVLFSSCEDLGMDENVLFTCEQVLSAAVATQSTAAFSLIASVGIALLLLREA
jgi:hypothetical protein